MKSNIFLSTKILFIFLSFNSFSQQTIKSTVQIYKNQKIESKYLKRTVIYDIVLPPNYENLSNLKTLYMNDGQDFEALKMESILKDLYEKNEIEPFVLIAIHTNQNRLQEYGTAGIPDYKKRGGKAKNYTDFVIKELKKEIGSKFKATVATVQKSGGGNYFCGFSLGGLSAIDIVWQNPKYFSKVGVFSGSFWWRKKAYEDGYDDHNDRIMHVLVRNEKYKKGMKFWFECGTNDEKDDRNGNGIIDSIDDTQDLIKELEQKGYEMEKDIVYHEIKGGEHNPKTWSEAMPVFLKWLFN